MSRYVYSIGADGFEDWTGLHALLVDCFAFMAGRIDPPSSLERMDPATLRRKAETERLVVVRAGDELVGCGFLSVSPEAIYLGKLAVSPAHRGRGILREIVRLATDMAREAGKSKLELQARIELVENHATFAALGFRKAGETSHPGYDRPTSITMVKAV